MKVCILGDIHIGARNDNQIFADYHISFFTEQLFPYMKKEGITKIVQLGDIFDRRKFVNFNILDQWKRRVFDYMRDNDIEMDVIIGNHDVFYRNINDVNSPSLLLRDYSTNVNVYIEPTNIILGGDVEVLYVPWINQTNMKDTLKAVKKSPARYAFGHFEFAGFQMDKGMKHEDGMSTKEFKKFEAVFSGHYHHKSDDGHIFYLGIPYQMTWVDHGSTKGFHVWDTKTFDLEFIENPNEIFVRFVYDDSIADDDYHKGFDFSNLKDKYIKVIVNSKQNLYEFDQFMSKLYSQSPADIKIVELIQDELNDEDSIDLESTKDILEKYVKTIDNDSIDKVRLQGLLTELYTEALNFETV